DTDRMIGAFNQQFPEHIPLLSLQNGVTNLERIIQVRGAAQALAGSVTFGAKITAPGGVQVAVHAGDVKIGGIDTAIDYGFVKGIAEMFSAAGIKTDPTREIYKFLWGKMLYNCSLNGLAAILDVRYGELLEHESSRALIADIVGEIFLVLEREGRVVSWPSAQAYCEDLFERLLPLTANHIPSMLQDLQAGKRTEIDALNGTIVDLAEKHGLDVPVNWLITRLMKVKEKTAGEL
ncbi:MAG: 2-dehydropantoate 2-reductase, partial [Chitinivibrionales bacterium]|nr:2-dehydropantoate 2-reductase [Chitinivibrionales bacterium]